MTADIVSKLQAEANHGCGNVYELYCARFSALLDQAFPEGHPERALAIELSGGDYCQDGDNDDDDSAEGLCQHFLEPSCCPAGCGDVDYL